MIWENIRHRGVSKKVWDFLWKHIHGIYRLGRFWSHILGYEERATCPICSKNDTLDHIITECDSTEQQMVWEQANNLWRRRYDTDFSTSEGAILGTGLANFK